MRDAVPDLVIDWIGGNCPVQGEGTICGKEFYFRARGEGWSFGVGGDVVLDPEWSREGTWGDGPFDAGWMSEDDARQIIERCAAEFIAEQRDGRPGDA
jgi:hypothetical protein